MNRTLELVEVNADSPDQITPIKVREDLPFTDSGPTVRLMVGGADLMLEWGQAHHLGTCAYWADQCRQRSMLPTGHAIGRTLREEVAACLLGGFGSPAEVGLSAFRRLVDRGVLAEDTVPSPLTLEQLLLEPLSLSGGRRIRYRFPKQRANRLATALAALSEEKPPDEPLALRQWLLRRPGIGPKTASWIVRNHTGTSAVAIIDVHVHRAGIVAGFFHEQWHLPRDYPLFERAFLAVSELGSVSPADLDACIWGQLHALGRAGGYLLGSASPSSHRESPRGMLSSS